MNCRLALFLMVLGLAGWVASPVRADSFELTDKSTVNGQPAYPDKNGIIIKGDDGKLSDRVPWTNFTQTALKKLSELPAAKPFVEPLLEPDDEPSKQPAPEITLKPVPRLPRPSPRAGLGTIFASPLSATLIFVLYLANIYAGYEVSIFRNQPSGLVCGVAAVAPVIGPIIFLSLPTRIARTAEELADPDAAQEEFVHAGEGAGVEQPGGVHSETHAAAPHAAAAGAPRHPPATVYQRGQTTFNRRFFETKLSGFLRVVPSEAEKDMVVHIRSLRGEHTGHRLSKVLPNELYLQIHKGGASSDVVIPYSEIQEVQIRHKEG